MMQLEDDHVVMAIMIIGVTPPPPPGADYSRDNPIMYYRGDPFNNDYIRGNPIYLLQG